MLEHRGGGGDGADWLPMTSLRPRCRGFAVAPISRALDVSRRLGAKPAGTGLALAHDSSSAVAACQPASGQPSGLPQCLPLRALPVVATIMAHGPWPLAACLLLAYSASIRLAQRRGFSGCLSVASVTALAARLLHAGRGLDNWAEVRGSAQKQLKAGTDQQPAWPGLPL